LLISFCFFLLSFISACFCGFYPFFTSSSPSLFCCIHYSNTAVSVSPLFVSSWSAILSIFVSLYFISLFPFTPVGADGVPSVAAVVGLDLADGGHQPPGQVAGGVGVLEHVSPAVVNISVSAQARDQFGRVQQQQGTGSGFIVDRQGNIVTNQHVTDGATRMDVTLADETTYAATVVATDPASDLAVIKLQAPADVLAKALQQAREARLAILEVMAATLPQAREEVGPTAPKIISFEIPMDKIGEVIGPKGKVINKENAPAGRGRQKLSKHGNKVLRD